MSGFRSGIVRPPTESEPLARLRIPTRVTSWVQLPSGFPGSSPMARRYAISGLDEARAYLAHPVLGSRLRACVAAVNGIEGRTAHDIFGSPDDLKFRSCLTLFARAGAGDADFNAALAKYYGGAEDPATVRGLAGPGDGA